MRIIIVDDKKENQYLLETLLKGNGNEVVSVANGAEALERLRSGRFDLIVSDILMPVMDGFQMCREVKRDEAMKNIPLVFYTATYTEEKDEELALQVGADRFVRKPVEPDKFLKLIRGVIRDAAEGKIRRGEPGLKEEKEILNLYSERLVKKLEGKMLALEREVTDRKRAEQGLKDYQLRLKKLASELTLTEERLKRTVATELHDRISQSLAVSKSNLVSLQQSIHDPSLQKSLTDITDMLTETLDESRSLTSQLSYPALNILGLARAIELWLEEEIGVKHGLQTCFSDDGLDKPLDEDVKAVLFRNVREALNNIIKHAQARHVTVTVQRDGGDVVVWVTDDGIGFDPQSLRDKACGFGILSIQESLASLGGRLEIETGNGSGCEVTLRAPLMGAEQAKDSSEGDSSHATGTGR